MASAFQFDILSLVGKAFDDLMSQQPWVSYNYSQCHPNTEVNVASQQQATSLVEQIQSVRCLWIRFPYMIITMTWTFSDNIIWCYQLLYCLATQIISYVLMFILYF